MGIEIEFMQEDDNQQSFPLITFRNVRTRKFGDVVKTKKRSAKQASRPHVAAPTRQQKVDEKNCIVLCLNLFDSKLGILTVSRYGHNADFGMQAGDGFHEWLE